MVNKALKDELSLQLLRASLKGKYGMTEVAEKHDITLMQALALCLLEPDQAVPMNLLSHHLSCDPSNVTGIVDRLVVGEFIERKESQTDRRIKMLSLTPSGATLRLQLLEIATESRFPNLEALTADEMQMFIELIQKATASSAIPG